MNIRGRQKTKGVFLLICLMGLSCNQGLPGSNAGSNDVTASAGTPTSGRSASVLPMDADGGLSPVSGGTVGLDASMASADMEVDADLGCTSGEQCTSGYCVPGPDGRRVCTNQCAIDADCPAGWDCLPVANTRPDTVFICVA
ncbi:MAG: hypothetical protein VX589_05030, partial [Myxococcota bacterium]|nr:hypothetical protein [Myxococcota bacterium]